MFDRAHRFMNKWLLAATVIFAQLGPAKIAFCQSTIAVKREILSVDMGWPGCVISVIDYFDGHLASRMKMTAGYWADTTPVQSTRGDFGIRFKCRIDQQFDNAAQSLFVSARANRRGYRLLRGRNGPVDPVSDATQEQPAVLG